MSVPEKLVLTGIVSLILAVLCIIGTSPSDDCPLAGWSIAGAVLCFLGAALWAIWA